MDRLLVPDSVVGMAVAYLLATLAFAIAGYVLIGDELRESLLRLRRGNIPSPLAREG
jgi:hypothetical protein